jgi:hypothetical protein
MCSRIPSGYVGYTAYSIERDVTIAFLSNDHEAAAVRSDVVGKVQQIIEAGGS